MTSPPDAPLWPRRPCRRCRRFPAGGALTAAKTLGETPSSGAARSGSAWTCLAWIESCFSVVTVWHALHGHCVDDVISHRTRACWYTTKTDPSYDDMTVKFRRVIIAARIGSPCPEQATPQEPGLRSLGRCGAHDQQEPRNTKPPGRF